MCGIAGMVSFDGNTPSLEGLQRMCAATAHRGPDDFGLYADAHAVLGMRRLSIIDRATGRQPVHNEDGTVWVVCNGEIYNYRQLTKELTQLGHTFHTQSDTEVIVHAYEEYGPEAVGRLRGMFAFALWDQRHRRLLLARDRFGIKPLYYGEFDGRLVFASEVKALLQLPEVERRLNWSAVGHLLSWMCTPSEESIVEGIHKLEPAHMLLAATGRPPELRRYWDLDFTPERGRSEESFAEELAALLKESVELHMVSEVPVGAFLSGGVDSGAVVAMMSRLSSRPVKTFSIGFPDQDFSELAHARIVSDRFGTDHHELIVEPDVVDILEDLTWYLDEPFGDSSAIPTYLVSQLASQHVTVVLSGDGGDELFGGYDKYLVERSERRFDHLPASFRRAAALASRLMPARMRGKNFLRHMSMAGSRRYLDALTLFRLEDVRRLLTPDAYRSIAGHGAGADLGSLLDCPDRDWLSRLQHFDVKRYLPLDILTKVDRMSMAHSIEARVPLLDHVLAEFAAKIPADMRVKGTTTKHIFKKAMHGILPDGILNRPKQGFAVPLGRWFRGQLRGYVHDLLLSDVCRQRGILDPSYVRQLLARHDSGRELDLHLWTLISFELWCRAFLDPAPAMIRDSLNARRVPSLMKAVS
jgi:asparagine synthase (glutamine-hydrolysing)